MELIEEKIDSDLLVTEEEKSELRGRGRYCRMMGYRGKAKRACKKRLRQQDRAMSRAERRAAAKNRKAQWKAYKRGELDLENLGDLSELEGYGSAEEDAPRGQSDSDSNRFQYDDDDARQKREASDDDNKLLKNALWITGGVVVGSLLIWLGVKAFKNK